MSASDFVVVWDGTSAGAWGKLMFPVRLPEPVVVPRERVLPALIALPLIELPPPPVLTRTERARKNAFGGEVAEAKNRMWALLEFPCSSAELIHTLSLPKSALATAMRTAVKSGAIVTAGSHKNEPRLPGTKRWSQLYMRAPKFSTAARWPSIHMTRVERRAKGTT